jgi:hypothetical protein
VNETARNASKTMHISFILKKKEKKGLYMYITKDRGSK